MTGAQWIEVVLSEGQRASGPVVEVRAPPEEGLSERLFGTVNPLLGTTVVLMGLLVAGLFLALMTRRTTAQGAKESIDWDDFDDFDDDEEGFEAEQGLDDEIPTAPPAAAAAASAPQVEAPAKANEGWMQGADGVWWYRDPADGSWWYRDADGVDRRHG